MHSFWEIFQNIPLRAGFFGWLVAQLLKGLLSMRDGKEFDLGRFFGSGGMPSSHTASVIAATASAGMLEGFASPVFALGAVFSLVVMYDATSVRWETGKQAEAINELVELIKGKKHLTGEKLKELIGHSPLEVWAGFFLGAAIGAVVTLLSL